MSAIDQRINALSPEKRRLLEQLMKETQEVADYPLSFAQQRLWFLDQLMPGNAFYTIPIALRLRGKLGEHELEKSFKALIERHEILRTCFISREGQPRQTIAGTTDFALRIEDLTRGPAEPSLQQAQIVAQRAAQEAFNLEQSPLLRAVLIRLAQEDHVLVITMPHIISDGWSTGVLVRELAALYQAFLTGREHTLPELAIQYADAITWQHSQMADERLARQLAYWKGRLEGAPAMLSLPIDRPRPAVQTFRGDTQAFLLPKALLEALKAFSQQEQATLFMTLLAGFVTLLYRHSGQNDIVVGTSVANRNNLQVESLIGLFVNDLALRVDFAGVPTFRALLARVRAITLEAYEHQDASFEKVVEAVQPNRSLSYTPLHQVEFILQNTPVKAQRLPNLEITPLEIHTGTAKADLTLVMEENEGGLAGKIIYATDLFDQATIKRLAGHFEMLLASAIANPNQPIATLPMLTAREYDQTIRSWNATDQEYPRDTCIHALFEEQVQRTPENIAVSYKDQRLTYDELNRRANQLAHYLRSLGVGPEVFCGLLVQRSIEMAVGILGILKAGGAYIPLDPSYPADRLAFMIDNAQIKVLLTQSHLIHLSPQGAREIVCLDHDWDSITSHSDVNPASGASAAQAAYIIYTSGSTGRPKGSVIDHRALVNFTRAAMTAFELTDTDRFLQFASISFDVAVEEIYPTWLSGATLVLHDAERLLSFADLNTMIVEERLSGFELPTAYWHEWVHNLVLTNTTLPETLRFVIIGGDRISLERLAQWSTFDIRLIHVYGLTEVSVTSTIYDLPAPLPPQQPWSDVPIGTPIANTQIYLLDPYFQPTPIGVAGEMYIAGDGLARGYHSRPDLTAERFIPNPFATAPGARMYKTGDLAYYLPDGNIIFIGRTDFQVKIRGFRIELTEIEAVLQQHPDVRECVVVAREAASLAQDKYLAAYITVKSGEQISKAALQGFLSDKLPEYMIPAVFITLDALPLSPNGKLDRRALPAPEGLNLGDQPPFIAPQTAIQEQIAVIWRQVLQRDQVGINETFFELGGHSLLLAQVHSSLRAAVAPEITMLDLFRYPTIEALAEYLGKADAGPTEHNRALPGRAEQRKAARNRLSKQASSQNQGD